MDIFIIVMLVGLGLIFGSFVNALVWRLHSQEDLKEKIEILEAKRAKVLQGKGEKNKKALKALDRKAHLLKQQLQPLSMSKGRSMCSNCRHPLAPKDLIPLFSWLWLRGKCRYCRKPIEDTPLLEVGLPVVFVASYLFWPLNITHSNGLTLNYALVALLFWLVFLIAFAALTAYDIRWFLLPDKIVWPLVVAGLLQVVIHATIFDGGWHVVLTAFWGVVICSGIFYMLFTVSKGEWIGGGDVRLGIVLGLLVGGPLQGLLLIFAASVFGCKRSCSAHPSFRLVHS
jgi:prepilin signal peptidase PulO-like enzyme (type II secretory pathway)